jgi:hypothetical protein
MNIILKAKIKTQVEKQLIDQLMASDARVDTLYVNRKPKAFGSGGTNPVKARYQRGNKMLYINLAKFQHLEHTDINTIIPKTVAFINSTKIQAWFNKCESKEAARV